MKKALLIMSVSISCLLLTSCEAILYGMMLGVAAATTPTYTPYYTPTYTPTYTPSYSSSNSSSSQSTTSTPKLKKELKIESDGFSWYRTEQGSKQGAQTTSGSTIIPLGDYSWIYYSVKEEFPSGGYFEVSCPSGDHYGTFSKTGTTLIPLSREYTFINFYSEPGHVGYFGVEKNGKEGACDIDGKEIIAPRYESIIFSTSSSEFKYKDSQGNWQSLGYTLDANGRGVRMSSSTPAVASNTTSTSSSKSSSTSSSSGRGKLLYKGSYTSNGTVYTGNQTMQVMATTIEVEIYENVMLTFGAENELVSVLNDGTRKYKIFTGDYYLVSPNYSIKKVYPSQFFGVPDGIEYYQKGQSATPAPVQQYPQQQYPQQQQYDNPQPTPQPQPQQKKICKWCNGTRRISKENGFSLGMEKEYCSECRQTVVSGHYHIDCPYCHGTGYE